MSETEAAGAPARERLRLALREVYMEGASAALGEMGFIGIEKDDPLDAVEEAFDAEWARVGRPGCGRAIDEVFAAIAMEIEDAAPRGATQEGADGE